MKPVSTKKACPACAARMTRLDVITRWPRRAKVIFGAATAVTLVWGPVASVILAPILLDPPGKTGLLILAAAIVGPGLGIASFTGRQERLACCRSCGWRGPPAELVLAASGS